jgi:uncharacterized protein (DUF4415 family)
MNWEGCASASLTMRLGELERKRRRIVPDEDFEMPDVSEIDPAFGAELAGTTRVTLRLDDDLLDCLKGTGPGWQRRINATLREVHGL